MLCTILLPLLTAGVATALLTCRPEGPVVPSPSALGSSSAFRATVANLTSTIERALNGSVEAGWAVANTSFSLAVVDIGSTGGVPLWEYHHLGSANTRGTPNVTRDSLYLIGSISKVLTDLVLLRSGVDVDAPVTVLLPELAGGGRSGGRGGGRGGIEWEHISLRALASHTAGIPPNCMYSSVDFTLKEARSFRRLPSLPPTPAPGRLEGGQRMTHRGRYKCGSRMTGLT